MKGKEISRDRDREAQRDRGRKRQTQIQAERVFNSVTVLLLFLRANRARQCILSNRIKAAVVPIPSSANVQPHLASSFAVDGNASWYSVCRVPMVG